MSVKRICVRDVDVATPEESVITAASRMSRHNVGTLVVVDDNFRPVGLLTDRDLTIRVLGHLHDPWETRVSDVMTEAPCVIDSEMPVEAAVSVMRGSKCRRLPVVGDDGRLVGILSLDDILQSLADEMTEISAVLEDESPRSLSRSAGNGNEPVSGNGHEAVNSITVPAASEAVTTHSNGTPLGPQSEDELWRQEIGAWKADVRFAFAEIDKIAAALRDHEKALRLHAYIIGCNKADTKPHFAKAPDSDQWTCEKGMHEVAERQGGDAEKRRRWRRAHERIKKSHSAVVSMLNPLAKALPAIVVDEGLEEMGK